MFLDPSNKMNVVLHKEDPLFKLGPILIVGYPLVVFAARHSNFPCFPMVFR